MVIDTVTYPPPHTHPRRQLSVLTTTGSWGGDDTEVEVVVGVVGISEHYHGRLMGVNCRGTGGRVRLRVANAARFTLCHVDDGGVCTATVGRP